MFLNITTSVLNPFHKNIPLRGNRILIVTTTDSGNTVETKDCVNCGVKENFLVLFEQE